MANKIPSRKKPVSQKRVAMVLASLVAMMTLGAGLLLAMEGGSLGFSVPAWAINRADLSTLVETDKPLRADAWKFIIIYESEDLTASAASLADGVVHGGNSSEPSNLRPKANFHFVIDGPSSGPGTMDGMPEVSSSWKEQDNDSPLNNAAPFASWPSARSHSYNPYTNAVGICLAADLNRKPVTEKQRQTLLQLVRKLQDDLDVPADRVLFRWEAGPGTLTPTPAELDFARSVHDALR